MPLPLIPLLAGAGVLKGLTDARGKQQEAKVANIKAVADAWTGKDWKASKANPWDYLTGPIAGGAQGALVGHEALKPSIWDILGSEETPADLTGSSSFASPRLGGWLGK